MKSQSTTQKTLRLYWQYMRQHRVQFNAIMVLTIVAVVVDQFIAPLLVSVAFNKLTTPHGQLQLLHDFGWILFWYGFIKIVVANALWRSVVWVLWGFEIEIQRALDSRVFSFLTAQSIDFHSNRFGGSLVSQATKFSNAFENLFDQFTFSIVTNIVAFVATVIILLPKAPEYVLSFLAITIVYVWLISRRTKAEQPFNDRHSSAQSKQTAKLADAIANVQTIKTFAHEKFEKSYFGQYTAKTARRSYETRRITTLDHIAFSGLNNSMSWLALFFGIFLMVNHNAPVGTLYLVTTYTMNLLNRLWELNNNMRNITRSFGDAHDMTELLQTESEIQDPVKPLPVKIHAGKVTFEDVTFTYPGKREPLFQDFSLRIKPGEKIGLVGHSGGGKTTVTKLILRFLDIQSGKIAIDGQSITDITQADLRSHISYVSQEPILFHRSLAENIRYGDLDATDDAVIAAAKMAHAHDFIEKLPEGYDTLVGERGVKLSGGQRQRIAIARAMLKNAPILLLDEATSALDSESEVLIQDALWKLMEGRTAIVIAHRLSTIQKMDRIVVLDDGKVVEEGSHKELLAKKGTYATLWKHQSGGFLEDDENSPTELQ